MKKIVLVSMFLLMNSCQSVRVVDNYNDSGYIENTSLTCKKKENCFKFINKRCRVVGHTIISVEKKVILDSLEEGLTNKPRDVRRKKKIEESALAGKRDSIYFIVFKCNE